MPVVVASDLGAVLASLLELPDAIAALKADLAEVKAGLAVIREAAPTEQLSVAQTARRLGVSEPTVRRLIKRGDIAVERVGRSVRVRASSLVTRDGSTIADLAKCARAR
ncbi:MAG: helix-turn-helix domain-containing protein [Labilithrix sp.]|nr:helix-turn-helix domain-containing protein [Labilithrix sp.]